MVFVQTKKLCHRLHVQLGLLGVRVGELHGNLSQPQRLEALRKFKVTLWPAESDELFFKNQFQSPKYRFKISIDFNQLHIDLKSISINYRFKIDFYKLKIDSNQVPNY